MTAMRKWCRKTGFFRAVSLRRIWRFTGHHVGHRGAVIAFLTMLDIIYGYSLGVTPGPLAGVNLVLSLHIWGLIWISTGVILLTGISARRDKFHYGVAVTLKVAWSVVMARAWILGYYDRGWVTAVIWAGFAMLVFIISSWPEGFIRKSPLDGKSEGEE